MSGVLSPNFLFLHPNALTSPLAFSQALSNAFTSADSSHHEALRSQLSLFADLLKESDPSVSARLSNLLQGSDVSTLSSKQSELVSLVQNISPETLRMAAEKLASLIAAKPGTEIGQTRFQSSAATAEMAREKLSAPDKANPKKAPIAMHPSLSHEEKSKLVEVYQNYPEEIKATLEKTIQTMTKEMGWSFDQQIQLLAPIAKGGTFDTDRAFLNLGSAIASMKNTGWNYDQQYDLLTLLVKKSEFIGLALANLGSAIAGMKDTGWSFEQQTQVLIFLAEKMGSYVDDAFSCLVSAIPGMKDTGWSFEQQFQLLSLLSQGRDSRIRKRFSNLDSAVAGLKDTGWSFEQQTQLLLQISEATLGEPDEAFKNLGSAIAGMKDTGWSFEQQIQLLTLISRKVWRTTGQAFANLGSAIAGMKKMALCSDWSPEKLYDFFGILIAMQGTKVHDAFRKLGLATAHLKATGWNFDQLNSLLILFAEKGGVSFSGTIFILGSAIAGMKETGSPYEHQYDILTHLVEETGSNIEKIDFNNLGFAIAGMKKAGFSFEQQIQLFARLVEKVDSKVQLDFEDLGSAISGMKKAGFSFEQQTELLVRLVEKAGNKIGLALENLNSAITGMKATGWSAGQKFDLLDRLAKNARTFVGAAYGNLPSALEEIKVVAWTPEQKYQFFLRFIGAKSGEYADACFKGLTTILALTPGSKKERSLQLFLKFFDRLSSHNVGVWDTFNQAEPTLKKLGQDYFPDHFELYVSLFERWPRLGFNLLEGLLEATEKGIIPRDLSSHRNKIFHFIEETNGFIPAIYKAYLKKGEGLFQKLRNHTDAILKDEFSIEDAQRIIDKRGVEFLLGIIQMTSPTSGASSTKKAEQIELLNKMLQAGDLRKDIPEKWKNKLETFSISQGAWRLKAGEVADPEGKLRTLMSQFRVPNEANKIEEENLFDVLMEYLQAGCSRELRDKVNKVLYPLAGQNNALREQISRVQDNAYSTLIFLEQLFGDKDQLPKILAEALDKVPAELWIAQGIKQKQVIRELLSESIELIKREKAKYAFQKERDLKMGLRAVKGPSYGLSGLTSGVCTAEDVELWKNPDFKLFAIINEDKGQTVGYLHVFETTIDGKKYLTLPGINPSAEFLGRVDAKNLYEKMMEKVIEFAKVGDFAGVYIPTTKFILSNRSDIQKAIQKSKYTPKKIPEVKWNTLPKPYPFEEVYVVWEVNSLSP